MTSAENLAGNHKRSIIEFIKRGISKGNNMISGAGFSPEKKSFGDGRRLQVGPFDLSESLEWDFLVT